MDMLMEIFWTVTFIQEEDFIIIIIINFIKVLILNEYYKTGSSNL